MSLRRLRSGELIALAGGICVGVSMFLPWYAAPGGTLDAWNTFGPAVVLLLAAAAGAFALALATVAERSTAVPVATGVWCVVLGLAALIAAIVRVLERPGHATALEAGAWLALAGAAAILAGSWQALRDERTSRYSPGTPAPRPRP